jgi:CRP-like cAMP-binding protein
MKTTMNANQLLAGLNDVDRAKISASLEPVKLVLGEHLENPRTPVPYVYFVDVGLVSVVAVSKRRERVEVGLIGNEGVTGISILLGPDRSPNEVMVQGEGSAQRIGVAQLRESMSASVTLREHLHRYVHVFFIQASHTALANGVGRLEERLARWLLMAHDRMSGDGLQLTHEFLAMMLAVRRSGVTVATHLLEGKGLIQAQRGLITVLDREGLIEAANGHYGIPEEEYVRVMGSNE